MPYRCNLCLGYLAPDVLLLLNHISRHHRSDPNFHVLCGIDGCSKTYRNFLSFRNHLIRKHDVTRITACNETVDAIPEEEPIPREEDAARVHPDLDCDRQQFDLAEQENIRKSNALCLLKFKEKGRVPQTVVDSFVENTTQIVKTSIEVLKSGVKSKLQSAGVDFGAIEGLGDLFGETNLMTNPFNGIDKERLQYKYYKDNFHLVEPQKIVLGRYHVKVRKCNRMKEIEKTDDAYYIPILESLQQLLNDDSILEQIDNPHCRNDNVLSDYCDGVAFKSHPLFKADPHALQLLLYFDEVEVCNPLGSRANKHKLAAFYFTLGNIKPENRSHMNAIQLLGLVTSNHLKKYGVDPILQAFMNDISQLEQDDGYAFVINGEQRNFRGTIAYISGDNLGSQFIGGFKQGSRAHRMCRVCMADEQGMKNHFHEDDFTLRTKRSYDYQCQRLDQQHFRKAYGLNQRCLLNDSRYYHVIDGLPADAMHDILEGVLQYCVKEVLKVFINEKHFFTLQELNKRLIAFDYGYHNDSNRPAQIQSQKLASNDNSLKQHAKQMWCLGLYLPLVVADLVPDEDEHLELLSTLLQILRIVFSPTINKDQLPYLQVLIQTHHEKFQQLFPQCSIIPKMHYMVHMPRTILQLGPLVRSWCMRYEAKHHYFKRLAILIGNWINLPFSLAKRHQEGLCYRLQSSEGALTSFIEKGIELGPGQDTFVGDVDYQNLLRDEIPDIDLQTPIYEAKWVTILGTKYKIGATLHVGFDDNDFPAFWEAKKICVVNRNVRDIMFIVSKKETIQFNEHYQSYEIVTPSVGQLKIAYSKDFTCYVPLNQIKKARSKFVCLPYEIDTPK